MGEGGLEVALVEQHLVGGECSYYACMPSKALLRPGELYAETQRIPGVREAVTGSIDVPAVLARRDEVVHNLDDATQLPWLEQRGVTLVRGHGRLDGERRVLVGDDQLVAERAVVVAVGTGALLPPIPGLAEARPWTNREATTASEPPESLVVLGGGVVGVELAQAWATLGSRVAIVEALDRLIAREEPFASEEVDTSLRERGIDVRVGAKATAVSRTNGVVRVELEDGSAVEGAELLVGVGRRPSTDELGLDSVGLEPGRPIRVDEQLRVEELPWLYAIGDANGRALLTHMGKYQGRVVSDVILGKDTRVSPLADGPLSPRVIFTDPQVAAVGHTLASAEEAGLRVRTVDTGTSANAGGSFYGRNAPGTTRFVVDLDRNILAGATFAGAEVSDFLHAATIAVVGEVPLDRLWHAVPSFPTRSEVWLRLFEGLGL
jgi:dihydrolipoamide dehydrogenase